MCCLHLLRVESFLCHWLYIIGIPGIHFACALPGCHLGQCHGAPFTVTPPPLRHSGTSASCLRETMALEVSWIYRGHCYSVQVHTSATQRISFEICWNTIGWMCQWQNLYFYCACVQQHHSVLRPHSSEDSVRYFISLFLNVFLPFFKESKPTHRWALVL